MIHFSIKVLMSFSIMIVINSCGGGGGGDTGGTGNDSNGTNSGNSGSGGNTVADTTLPLITIIGGDETIEAGSTYADKGATAKDNKDGDITSKIVLTNPVNTKKIGLYRVRYDVKDTANNSAVQVVRKVSIVDSTSPVIVMTGTDETIEAGSTYTDKGATASDNLDGDITSKIIVTNNVNSSTIGSYTVNYNVTDTLTNSATQVSRTVTVVDTTPPTITLIGKSSMRVALNSTYKEKNATLTDNTTGAISLIISGSVNTTKLGLNTINYKATDSNGNIKSINRSVYVTDLIKTGQTIVYTSEDNGNYTTGVDGNFTRSSSDKTVTDHIRNLTWQDDTPQALGNWSTQNSYCNNSNMTANSDWRLPTKEELSSLLKYNEKTLSINKTFQNTSTELYATSTPSTNGNYFYIQFSGNTKIDGTTDSNVASFRVRCVRGTSINEHNITKNNNILSDTNTALKWQETSLSATQLTWDNSLNYCKNLSLNNMKWRLPNINELQSLYREYKIDKSKAEANQIFQKIVNNKYWSSTTNVDANTTAYISNFDTSILTSEDKTTTNNIVCTSDM